MDDLQAVRRLKRGDLAGLEALMIRYQVKAARSAFLILQDEGAAQDVVQDTFIHIYRTIHRFDESRPFEPYLMRSITHAALNVARAQSRLVSLDDDPSRVERLLDHLASVESEVEASQLQTEVLSALARLSPRQRLAIVQRYYLEMSEREMAVALDAAPGTVKWLLNAARKRLQVLLRSRRSTP